MPFSGGFPLSRKKVFCRIGERCRGFEVSGVSRGGRRGAEYSRFLQDRKGFRAASHRPENAKIKRSSCAKELQINIPEQVKLELIIN